MHNRPVHASIFRSEVDPLSGVPTGRGDAVLVFLTGQARGAQRLAGSAGMARGPTLGRSAKRKRNCWSAGSASPAIASWPGRIPAGPVKDRHLGRPPGAFPSAHVRAAPTPTSPQNLVIAAVGRTPFLQLGGSNPLAPAIGDRAHEPGAPRLSTEDNNQPDRVSSRARNSAEWAKQDDAIIGVFALCLWILNVDTVSTAVTRGVAGGVSITGRLSGQRPQ